MQSCLRRSTHGFRLHQELGAMLLLTLIEGLSIPITKLGLGSFPPMTFTALRS